MHVRAIGAANAAVGRDLKRGMTIARDIRHGARALAKAPVSTSLAVAVLAVGIGATTAIFSLLDAVLLRPLPHRAPDALALLAEAAPDYAYNRVAPLNFVDWAEQNHTFQSMAGISGASLTFTGADGVPNMLRAQAVTTAFFELLGVHPVAGRTFVEADGKPGEQPIILSEGFWKSRFAGDPGVIGKAILLDRLPYTVVGVMPATF
jgi:hypothetical protein